MATGLTVRAMTRDGDGRAAGAGLRGRALAWLPVGHSLPEPVWRRRHRWVVGVLGIQVVLAWFFGLVMAQGPAHALLQVLPPAALGAAACSTRLSRRVRSMLAAAGLMVLSGTVVHTAGGVIEAHFHFFAMVPIVALYQSWWPFGAATAYVLVQHGVVGTIASSAVYNHPAARENPWTWALIHSSLFGLACLGTIVSWKLNEDSRTSEERMRHAAHHDALTGLPNRLQFFARLEAALDDSQAPEGILPTVLLIDLDGFKSINDRLGHHNGDAVLVEVAQRLRAATRTEDLVARLGGDEFVVLVHGSRPAADALAARIAEVLTEPITLGAEQVKVGASIGIATADETRDPDALVQLADRAMYRAKPSFGVPTSPPHPDAGLTGCHASPARARSPRTAP